MDRARRLLQSHGFEGFSYRDISSQLGIKNAAIHYHFPTKSDLGQALVEDFCEETRQQIAFARENLTVRKQLDAYFERMAQEFDRDNSLCPVGAMTTSLGTISDSMRNSLNQLSALVVDWLTETLEKGRNNGDVEFSGDARSKAIQISAAMQGARQLSRLNCSNQVERVAGQFKEELYKEPS
ncbi:MAG: TetR/AcrR family transcriptional regulator [Xanthomonadales bacterium]|nr:TetR/AcrR family transcriptional regulator [Xanthomonadales bacterium]